MPRPVFNIEEYELRGVLPPVYTNAQSERLNKTLSRVNGQIDWTAQLLGFNGNNYWGLPSPKSDFSYNWKGLPETMNEKRQMQVGAFGVYNKDKEYDQWPSPFNREELKASGDANIHIFERGGITFLSPAGQGEEIDYSYDQVLFAGASYAFDSEVEFYISDAASADSVLDIFEFYIEDQTWTRVKISEPIRTLSIRKKGSSAKYAFCTVLTWEDISDWTPETVKEQFLGIWGNKGNTLSMDFAFDALDLHGYEEKFSLSLPDVVGCITPEELIEKVGLETTEYTKFNIDQFNFVIGGCESANPVRPFPLEGAPEDVEYIEDGFEFFVCESDCNYTVTLSQNLSEAETCPTSPCPEEPEYYRGISEFCFTYSANTDCGKTEFPCIEWVFDPTLDDGEYERTGLFDQPWATANSGFYDRDLDCDFPFVQSDEKCEDEPTQCWFDNGEYERPTGTDPDGNPVSCDPEDEETPCNSDGGLYTITRGLPDYTDTADGFYCCLVDNQLYLDGEVYIGPEIVDGGSADPVVPDPNPVLCDTANARIKLDEELLSGYIYEMKPSIRNSLVPLRVWKNSILTVTDTVPPENTEYYNPLVADENRGPEPEDSYRYFVRLPLEYARNGKQWNRAIAVCDNQGYFSAPPDLAETEDNPPKIRPHLYSENYWKTDLEDYTVFYEEDYIVSQVREDNLPVQSGFEDSEQRFEPEDPIPYTFSKISSYDPFDLRIPYADGEWKGSYYVYGKYEEGNPPLRTGFLHADLETRVMIPIDPAAKPKYDYSYIKAPNVEFPDSNDLAPMKNYVVSYAYFVTDFSAADDPVFDPETYYSWRSPAITCEENINGVCETSCRLTNTAYRLHEYETSTC